jgi:cysteinyl-tRNA synthetase
MLNIHNSMGGLKEPFQPLEPGHVRMYVCGITVYDLCHVGHARSQVVFDVVRRWLQASGYQVTYVRNITDIDDKIIERAAREGVSWREITARYIEAMHEDFAALGVLTPDVEPRATEYIPQIVEMIGTLVEKGYAYVAGNGDVLYSVGAFPPYGRLSGKRLGDLRAGARVEIGEHKQDPLDFVLWKMARPGEPSWESPWGAGRPGWHIECSAMSVALLGDHFDIHGGGLDLKFPHHENEIAQSCAACEAPFAHVWMHNGFLNIDDEKMSKSLGNFFTIREVLPRLRPEVMRAFVLSSHYRGPINYSEEALRQADAALKRLYLALRDVAPVADGPMGGEWSTRFAAAMDDDFNTPEALAALQGLARALNTAKAAGEREEAGLLAAELCRLGSLLGLLGHDPGAWLSMASSLAEAADDLADDVIDGLVAARSEARQRREWAESDRLRAELDAAGVIVEDGPTGSSWRRK